MALWSAGSSAFSEGVITLNSQHVVDAGDMNTLTAKQLTNKQVEEIQITSACLSVCTVRVFLNGQWFWIVGQDGKIQRFNGPEHANNQLSGISTNKATLIHHSAHAEMVAQPEGETIPPLQVGFHWRSDHSR